MRMLLRSVHDPTALEPAVVERAYELSQEPAMRRAFAGVYAGAIHAFARARELHAGFARYGGPVFCAWGAHDRYINIAALRDVVRIYPHAKTLVLHKSGHLPMIEEPQTLATAASRFSANLTAPILGVSRRLARRKERSVLEAHEHRSNEVQTP